MRAGFAAEGIEDAVRSVDAIEIFGDFAAEKALRDGLRGIASTLMARPSSFTVTRTAQESGQSWEQTVWTMRKGADAAAAAMVSL